jgi:catechol-2,3-dioxygenase
MKPQFIDHIVIIIKDIKTTEEFYSKFLGEPEEKLDDSVVYKIGETKIFFGLPYGEWEDTDKNRSGLNHLAFGVRTLEELGQFEKILNETGIKNSGIQVEKYAKKDFIWFDDPDGNRLEFYCRPVNSA